MNKKVNMLLPMYPDERWYKWRKNGNIYAENCMIVQQEKYGNWQEVKHVGQQILNEFSVEVKTIVRVVADKKTTIGKYDIEDDQDMAC